MLDNHRQGDDLTDAGDGGKKLHLAGELVGAATDPEHLSSDGFDQLAPIVSLKFFGCRYHDDCERNNSDEAITASKSTCGLTNVSSLAAASCSFIACSCTRDRYREAVERQHKPSHPS
ncbi:MAG: hypothetical protein LBH06_07760, partial [Rikenellaceae bacterium]|nr:hypothetical protein [Rikenellaceae bacterium]